MIRTLPLLARHEISLGLRNLVAIEAIADSGPAELSVDLWVHGLVPYAVRSVEARSPEIEVILTTAPPPLSRIIGAAA